MKEFFDHVYGYLTDKNNDGDALKLCGFILAVVAVVRFAITGVFDAVSFGAGAAAMTASKGLDVLDSKKSV